MSQQSIPRARAETDSQKDSSWQTIQVSHDGFLPRSSESCSECIDGEAGNLAWKTKGNVAEHRDLQAVWNLKAVSSKSSEEQAAVIGDKRKSVGRFKGKNTSGDRKQAIHRK